MNAPESMSAAVRTVIDGYPTGYQFHGNQLKDDVVRIYPESRDQYPDTILRMARRHRRGAFRVVDRNDSLYEKLEYKSIIAQIREIAPKPEPSTIRTESAESIQLSLFGNQLFLAVFFGLAFGVAFVFGACFGVPSAALGRPLVPPSRMASMSALRYNPDGPTYRNGLIPFLSSLLLTAPEEMPNRCAISSTVRKFSSIYNNLHPAPPANQGENEKDYLLLDTLFQNAPQNGYFDIFSNIVIKSGYFDKNKKNVKYIDILLYIRIVVCRKFAKFLNFFCPTLDNPIGRGYIYYINV